MSSQIQRLRGFKDVFGEEAFLFSFAEGLAEEVFRSFGYEEIRIPALEEKSLFSRALGDQTDVVQKEMYEFKDRSDLSVALRPEGTAGVVRAYLENKLDKIHGSAKLFYRGPMFRAERPQAGRLRQFHQLGIEHLGTSSPYADAETILCLTTYLDRLGVKDYKLRLNNLGTLEERAALKVRLTEFFRPKIGDFCDNCKSRLEKNVFRLLDCKAPECRKAVRQAGWIVPGQPILSDGTAKESHDHFRQVCEALASVNVKFEIDPFMVRGLDYYTKTVFEVSHAGLGSQDALAAGGRYDHLIETFGGDAAGAVGFAIGVERLLLSTKFTKNPAKENPIMVVAMGEDAFRLGFVLLNALRRLGIPSIMELKVRSLKSQLRVAEKSGSRWVVLIGDEEIQRRKFILKDMHAKEDKDRQAEYDLDGLMAKFLDLQRTRYIPERLEPDFIVETEKKESHAPDA
ncbi:MAG TPA: histidine--tRNA ligase [Candidatus Eisenbacteria bacterium]|nr:histidine--tRNA ligase [Candidatus Eisenbacteria bacterium]